MPEIMHTTSEITARDLWVHFLARVAYKRESHRVEPGLYALGNPDENSKVFVTGNYTLSFDALRSALKGLDAYILVLNTRGINVWCAAGKGTFGTREVILRVEQSGLKEVVKTRTLILPQLGAPGVDSQQVRKQTGFRVEYGPVRADDLPEYLKLGKATPEMRQARFNLKDRMVLVPVELVNLAPWWAGAMVVCYLLGGWTTLAAAAACTLGAPILFFALFPWIPTRDFSSKGFLVGLLIALPFVILTLTAQPVLDWKVLVNALAFLLIIPAAASFIILNFTGSTPIPSRTGVRREIYRYVPWQAGFGGAGVLSLIAVFIGRLIGG